MRFKGIKLLGLFTIALGVMAVGASVAQALELDPIKDLEPIKGIWSVNKQSIISPLLPEVQVVELEKKEGVILTKSGLSKLEFTCTSVEYLDALLHPSGGTSIKAIHLRGCTLKLGGVEQKACVPSSPDTAEASGVVTILNVTSQVYLHLVYNEKDKPISEEVIELVVPEGGVGGTFVELRYPKGCSLTATKITGVIAFKDCEKLFLEEKAIHLFVEGPLSNLKYGTNLMVLDGGVTVRLVGGHLNQTWSAH